MARFIFFLAIFSIVYQSTIADDVERANINIVSKYGARNLINIPRPIDASDIISCTAKKSSGLLEKKTLSEVTKSGRTSGHFISRKDNCSFELTTTVDYGKWYISTEYYRKNDSTIQTQQDIVMVQPSISNIMKDLFVSARDSVNGSFTIPTSQQLKKVDMIKLSNDDADLKYQIYPINHHSSIFENLVCANGKCTVIFREWKDDYYGSWKVRTIAKDTRTHKWEQNSIVFEYKRPELKGARNETEEEIRSLPTKKIKTDVFQVSVGGRVSVHIESPERGEVVDCSVVYMENSNMRFDKKPGDYNDFIDFFKSGDCSFIMKNFGNDMYGKWQVTTNYKYNEDRFRSVRREQINIIHFEDKDEPAELRFVAPDFEFTVLPVFPGAEKILRVNAGEKLLLSPDNKSTGYVDRCEAVHVGEYEDTIYEILPNRDSRLSYDYNGFYTNCNFTFSPFEAKYYGKWIVSSYYTYPKNSGNRVREDVVFQINRKQ